MLDLTKKRCAPCEGGSMPYSEDEALEMLRSLKGWMIESARS